MYNAYIGTHVKCWEREMLRLQKLYKKEELTFLLFLLRTIWCITQSFMFLFCGLYIKYLEVEVWNFKLCLQFLAHFGWRWLTIYNIMGCKESKTKMEYMKVLDMPIRGTLWAHLLVLEFKDTQIIMLTNSDLTKLLVVLTKHHFYHMSIFWCFI